MSRIKCFFLEATEKEKVFELFDEDGNKTGSGIHTVYRRSDTGEEMTLRDAPPGAMYYADWYDSIWQPQLEHVLIVILPNRFAWVVDGQSSNCGRSDDHNQREHHCWIIEGVLPNITVSKNGKTCQAGAGSILAGNYHGFLRNGYLEEC
ncbi:MAG TPA: hypothetical protein VF648_18980 [Pyrinomonadaceae bacterium]|jgi:hypothetical protein